MEEGLVSTHNYSGEVMAIDLLRSCANDQERLMVLRLQHTVATALREWAVANVMQYPVRSVKVLGDNIEITMLENDAKYRLKMEKIS